MAFKTIELYINKKARNLFCSSFHSVKALASPKLSKRATPKAPRRCKYIIHQHRQRTKKCSKPMMAVYNTPHEAFPLLCSWQLLLELPDSYTVKTKAYKNALILNVVFPHFLPNEAFGERIDVANIVKSIEITKLLSKKVKRKIAFSIYYRIIAL